MQFKYNFYPVKIFLLIIIIKLGYTIHSIAQNIPTPEIVKVVHLDSVMVIASGSGFNISDFIDLIKNDTTFYQAFRNLKSIPFHSDNSILIFSKKNNVKASLHNSIQQSIKNNCRWQKNTNEKTTGNFYNRKKEYQYYTAEMFADLFWIKDTICDVATHRISQSTMVKHQTNSSTDKRKEELKTLIFNPGSEIEGIPLISKKMAIFDEKMSKYYDYFISSINYLLSEKNDTVSCYVFTVKKKNNLGYFQEGKVVIDSLTTYFSRKNFSIVARKYSLSYSSILFDFNISMEVQLQNMMWDGTNARTEEIQPLLIPRKIIYNGYWDVPFNKPEIARFDVNFHK